MITAIATFLVTRTGLPERFGRLAAWAALIVAAVALFVTAKAIYDASVIDEYEADVQEEVQERAKKGEADASEAADDTRRSIEEGNDNARKAADGSDDALADALRSLRSNGSN